MRAVKSAVNPKEKLRIKGLLETYQDPEDWEDECRRLDNELSASKRTVLVIFDSLDVLAYEHDRLRKLLDALLQVTWAVKGYQSIRIKLFLRDDQVSQLGLKFAELPKLMAGATRLYWHGTDLYGMLFKRLAGDLKGQQSLDCLLKELDMPPVSRSLKPGGVLSVDKVSQAVLFSSLVGQYMGRTNKKGKTYDWSLRHLSDGHSEVTPRSFLALMINAATYDPPPGNLVLSAEGLRHGLREASKIRVEQLALEFPWIRRVLAPLARLQVPCTSDSIKDRWEVTETYPAVLKLHDKQSFMLPFSSSEEEDAYDELLLTLKTIGVLMERDDERYDMPDLFRVAARLLKKGGVKVQGGV
jgi:hypothetical protein